MAITHLMFLVLHSQSLHNLLHLLHFRLKNLRLLRLLDYHIPCPIDNFPPENIDMSLGKLQRFYEKIISITNKIDVHQVMISRYAVYSFIIIHGVSGSEFDNNSKLGFCVDLSYWFAEAENVFLVCEKLKCCRDSAVILDMENSLLWVSDLDRSEIKRLICEIYGISLGYSLAFKFDGIPADTFDFVVGTGKKLWNCWFVFHFDKIWGFSWNISWHLVESKRVVPEVVCVYFGDLKMSWYLAQILDYHIFVLNSADQNALEVVLFMLYVDKRIFSNRWQLYHLRVLLLCIQNSLRNMHGSSLCSVRDRNILQTVGSDRSFLRIKHKLTLIKVIFARIRVLVVKLELVLRFLVDRAEIEVVVIGHVIRDADVAMVLPAPRLLFFHLNLIPSFIL